MAESGKRNAGHESSLEYEDGDRPVVYIGFFVSEPNTPKADAVCAIYFGDNNSLNESRRLWWGSQTSERAEIFGVRYAIYAAKELACFKKLKIITPSDELVRLMTDLIPNKYAQNDYTDDNGILIANKKDLQTVYELSLQLDIIWEADNGSKGCEIAKNMAKKHLESIADKSNAGQK